ncbi:MAG: dihydroorotase [Coriobacteriales bacterium]|jgi:dihydroorotase|nr:dihydroorotase [Coriobacteriales bacterium]
MKTMLKGARCVDPQVELDDICDIILCDEEIAEVGRDLQWKATGKSAKAPTQTIDCTGKMIVPGLFDMHVHLRDPGYEYKEDVASGGAAAAKGGFSDVLAMPNTSPVCDTGSRVSFVLDKAASVTRTNVHVAGSLTKGLAGNELSEMGDMAAAGAAAFTDDGHGVQDAGMMRRCMDYAKQFDKPVLSHCQIEDLAGAGVVNEGMASTRLGVAGWPAEAEEMQIERDIMLCRLTGCRLHIQHITTARGVELVREAKDDGLPVTCEVTPHHLFLCEDDIDKTYNTNLKMNPPLRTREDMLALRSALIDGVIDCVATDHAPHAAHEKAMEFELAPFGTTGLETALGLVMTRLDMPLATLVERMSHAPRRILGLKDVTLAKGSPASVTIIDPNMEWTVSADSFASKATNSAFIGWKLKGRATDVFVCGRQSLKDGKVVL